MRRRRLLVALALALGVVGVAARTRSRPTSIDRSGPAPVEQPFTDLGTATEVPGWELHIPLRHPGPYRRFRAAGESMLGGSDKTSMICRVRDGGTVVEELRVEGNPAFDQLVIQLETPSGQRTMAVLKRPR
jgi:hypothetical protein